MSTNAPSLSWRRLEAITQQLVLIKHFNWTKRYTVFADTAYISTGTSNFMRRSIPHIIDIRTHCVALSCVVCCVRVGVLSRTTARRGEWQCWTGFNFWMKCPICESSKKENEEVFGHCGHELFREPLQLDNRGSHSRWIGNVAPYWNGQSGLFAELYMFLEANKIIN